MKKRIYLVLETEADEDDKSILDDIEQELGMATHYFETCSYSEIRFEGLWRSTFEQPPHPCKTQKPQETTKNNKKRHPADHII